MATAVPVFVFAKGLFRTSSRERFAALPLQLITWWVICRPASSVRAGLMFFACNIRLKTHRHRDRPEFLLCGLVCLL
jgi:hypothetical protein